MLSLEQKEQLLDYVDLTLAIAEGECAKCLSPYKIGCSPCSSCPICAVRIHLQEAHNALMQIAIPEQTEKKLESPQGKTRFCRLVENAVKSF